MAEGRQDEGGGDEIIRRLDGLHHAIDQMDVRVGINTNLIGQVLKEVRHDPDAGESELVKALKAVVARLDRVEAALGRVEKAVARQPA
jgi:hypothetical protein